MIAAGRPNLAGSFGPCLADLAAFLHPQTIDKAAGSAIVVSSHHIAQLSAVPAEVETDPRLGCGRLQRAAGMKQATPWQSIPIEIGIDKWGLT